MERKWCPTDTIAVLVLIGAFALKFAGIDGIASLIIVGIVGFYFGLKLPFPGGNI